MTPNQAIEYGAKCLEKWKDWNRADQEQIEFYKAAIEALKKEVVAVYSTTNADKPHIHDRYMYHVTERPYLDSIITNGEGLNRTAHRQRIGIYLCSKPSNWIDSFREPAVIKVDLEGLDCFMSAFPENDEVIVWGDIPVERLTVVDPADWYNEYRKTNRA